MNKQPKTLFQKIWDQHVVLHEDGAPAVLYIDLHLVHEVTSPQAFAGLKERGLWVRRPDRTFATVDHGIPTIPPADGDPEGRMDTADEQCKKQIKLLEDNCRETGIQCFGIADPRQGIVHVIGPENGLTQPGMTIVCGDSHTATHGAFGALAFGIGTSEVEHVLVTQCLLQNPPRTMEIRVEGDLKPNVTAKDIILAIIARIGVGGGTGYVIEYTGSAIRGLDMDGRMTLCNMSIECGARAGMVAPDEITFNYLKDKKHAPSGAAWDKAVAQWQKLKTDDGASYDSTVELNAAEIEPMITYGTNPGMGMPISGSIPAADDFSEVTQKDALRKALGYMGFESGSQLLGQPVDVVFIGSCTNGRISDLRQAAEVMKGRKVADGVRVLVVPGSQEVKRQAEAEGLDKIFTDAGAEWREAGCSMCIAMNGDQLEPGQVSVSTSNRNFEGRQGKGGKTLLASPLTAAASAVMGQVTDVRNFS